MSGRRSILDELRDSAPRLLDADAEVAGAAPATGVAARVETALPGNAWPSPVNSGWSPDNGGPVAADATDGIAEHEATPPGGENGEEFRGYAASETGVAMLDLVFKSGQRVALPYATLIKAEFDPGKGITLHFAAETVEIGGRRLDDLYRAIIQHRAREVIEGDEDKGFDTGGKAAAVTAIRRIMPEEEGPASSDEEAG